jgi:hypothetical protein
MAAYRCTLCGVNYPSVNQFYVCPIHDEKTQILKDTEPDEDWKHSFELRQKWAETEEGLRQLVPRVNGVSATEVDGQLWVENIDLQHAGLRLSRMMPDQFYLFELDDGWIYETQGFDDPRRRWWVERVIEAERPFDLAEDLGLVEPADEGFLGFNGPIEPPPPMG